MKASVILILFSLSTSACNYFGNPNFKKDKNFTANLEVSFRDVEDQGRFIKYLEQIGLSDLVTNVNGENFSFSFATNFDSTLLTKLFSNGTTIKFKETYGFEDLIKEFEPIIKPLATLGSENAINYLRFNDDKTSNSNGGPISFPFFGSTLGTFPICDTASVNTLVNRVMEGQVLPHDLVFNWSKSPKEDSLSLYLLKSKYASAINQDNIVGLSTSMKSYSETIEHDENFVPTKWRDYELPEIDMIFNEEGAEQFYELTNKNISKRIAIVINNDVYSAPMVVEAVQGGRISISLNNVNDIILFYNSTLFEDFPSMKVKSLSIDEK